MWRGQQGEKAVLEGYEVGADAVKSLGLGAFLSALGSAESLGS